MFLTFQVLYAAFSIVKIYHPSARLIETGAGFLSLIFIYMFSERLARDRENQYILAMLFIFLGVQVGLTTAIVSTYGSQYSLPSEESIEMIISVNAAIGILISSTFFLLRAIEMYNVSFKKEFKILCLLQLIGIIIGFYGMLIYFVLWTLRIEPGFSRFLLPLISSIIFSYVYYRHPLMVYMLSQKIYGIYIIDKSGTLINGVNYEKKAMEPLLIAGLLSAICSALKEATGVEKAIDFVKFKEEAFILVKENRMHDLIAIVNRRTPPLLEGLSNLGGDIDEILDERFVESGIVTSDVLPYSELQELIRKHLFFVPQVYG